MRSSRCDNCGALASDAARCRYCGAVVGTDDLVAAGFGDGDGAIAVMPDAEGVRVTVLGVRALRVDVPPATEVGPAHVGCAWTRGVFVDLDVGVAIRFERAPDGIAAGVWLRSSRRSAVSVMLELTGEVSVAVRRDEGRQIERLGAVGPPDNFRAGVSVVLRARVAGDVLTIYRNGLGVLSVKCPTDFAGGADFVVDVPHRERGSVVFEDVCARLP
jgi:hypothetical protein